MNRIPPKLQFPGGRAVVGAAICGVVIQMAAAGCTAIQNPESEKASEPAAAVLASEKSDPSAIAAAEALLKRLGGRNAWEDTRFVRWNFFGGRRHAWDRHTGDIRIETEDAVLLLNLETREGAARIEGEVVSDPDQLAAALDQAWAMWVNDAYWMFLPYKLLDPGVVLEDLGPGTSQAGATGQVLRLTFESVGLTPQNAYTLFIDGESGLLEEWSFWPDAAAGGSPPAFTMPWSGWRAFGNIWLATDHGRGADWAIEVPSELPAELFTDL